MDWSWIPIFGSVIDAAVSSSNTKKANETNLQIAREQQAWSEKMWNMQNEYNSPDAVLKRYVDAGINPNMVVGQVSGGMATNPVPYQRANVNPMPPTSLGNAMAMAYQLKMQKEQLGINQEVGNSQAFKNKAEGISELIKQPGLMSDNRIRKLTADFLEQTFENRKLGTFLANDLTEAQINSLNKTIELNDKYIEQIDNSIFNQTRMTDAQIHQIDESIQQGWKNLDIQLKNAVSNRLMADAAYINAKAHEREVMFQEAYTEELKKQVKEATRGMKIQNNFLRDTYSKRVEQIEAQVCNLWLQGDWQGLQNYMYREMLPWTMANQRYTTIQNGFNTAVQPLRFQMEWTNSFIENFSGLRENLPARWVRSTF